MKRLLELGLWNALGLCLLASASNAGPNATGTLIVHGDPSVVYTDDIDDFSGESPLPDGCTSAITNYPADQTFVWWVKAAFAPDANPRLVGITFGIDYDENAVILVGFGPAGDFELPNADWPAPSSGTAVTFQSVRTSELVDIYWFAGYNYSNYASDVAFDLVAHPTQGGFFADDDIPSTLDPINTFGSLGFGGNPGSLPCPLADTPIGACCFPDLSCSVITSDECSSAGGSYLGDDLPCDPNPCQTEPSTGACCSDLGSCSIKTREACENAHSYYMGDGAPCNPDPCPKPGACCFGEECQFLSLFDCTDLGGVFVGEETSCSPSPCLPPTGGCCFTDGSCRFLNESDCDREQGTYQGDESACEPNPCPPPPTGVCCLEDEICEILTVDQCGDVEGHYLGDDLVCEPNPCLVTPQLESTWGAIKNLFR